MHCLSNMKKKGKIGDFFNRKSIKLSLLLMSALLIATTSTNVYYGLLSESSVGIVEAKVHFTAGDDSTAAGYAPGANETYCRLFFNAYANVTLYYEQAVNITNTDTAAHDIRLRHVTIGPTSGDESVGNFTQIDFKIVDKAGTVQRTLTYTTTGDTWNTPGAPTAYITLPASTEWTIQVETKAAPGASKVSCWIEIAVDVDE
ncbi:hypothetical protein E2P71_05010 [Candidatus Bathyarchaeota archaeon]|nr:hypothetical protein E2P71_05010 [Candidatus Bathyarchaeota archaeon]